MNVVGSYEFRRESIEKIKQYRYKDKDNFFQRYLDGEDFNEEKLMAIGYDYFCARNIDAYINNQHNDNYYRHALG